MARKKPKAPIRPVSSLEEADVALAEIAAIRRDIAAIEARMNEVIDQAKAAHAEQARPLQNRIAAIEAGLTAFATMQKSKLFNKPRSRDLDHGSIGFRKSTQLKPAPRTTWKMVQAKIKEMDFKAAIRTTEKINKEELETWPDERLAVIGVRRVQQDQFWYESAEEKLAETQAA